MKHFILSFLFVFMVGSLFAQGPTKSRVTLKNNDTVTGTILEMKAGEYIKMEVVGGNVMTIPYSEIANIVLDITTEKTTPGQAVNPIPSSEKPLGNFYFESYNEAVAGIGVGKMYGLPAVLGTVMNEDTYGGLYTSNGVGYKKSLFLGIGFGYNSHAEEPDYSIPYMLDFRWRIFGEKKFSPLVMGATGGVYHEDGIGSYTFVDGVGLSIRAKERLNIHLLFTHTYVRFMPNLIVGNEEFKMLYSNVYFNYVGIRAGVSFKL